MFVNQKDVQKEFNLALKHFRNAIKMAKKSLIIGEVNFKTEPKVVRARKPKNISTKIKVATDPADESNLPDADEKPYMLARNKKAE